MAQGAGSFIVRIVLLHMSVLGWIVMVFGVGYTYTDLMVTTSGSEKKVVQFKAAFLYPFWLFIASTIPCYVLYFLHTVIQVYNHNWAHIVHSLMNLYYVFFMASGGTSFFIAVGYILGGETTEAILGFNRLYMKVSLSGVLITIFFSWVANFIWPIFNYERNPHRANYEELQESTAFR